MNCNIRKSSFEEILKDIEQIDTDKILLITDHHVWSLYQDKLPLLKLSNKKVELWKTPIGETTKTFSELEACLEFFIDKGVHRKCHLIAFGGGAVSDFAGLVASMLLRGIEWSVIPTTLLAQVDASIGGKVGINSRSGKNLIGSFHMPKTVWVNNDFLTTLSAEDIVSGKGEILKYCLLDRNIHDLVINKSPLKDIINECAEFKKRIVGKDFKESGQRKILNLGHSIGHCIEHIYQRPHGESVVWGMIIVLTVFNSNKSKLINKLRELSTSMNFDLESVPWRNKDFPVLHIMEILRKDKKSTSSESIDIIDIEDIGNPEIKSLSFEFIEKELNRAKEELKIFEL